MKTLCSILFLSVLFLVCSCDKPKDEQQNTTPTPIPVIHAKIDVNNQYGFDYNGNILNANTSDSQWRAKDFTVEEMALFSSMDTADLSATSYPGPVADAGFYFMYPNPFSSVFHCIKPLANGFTGQTISKIVIVDSMLYPLYKKCITLEGTQHVALMIDLPAGKYRLYYTLNALSNEHFYRSWGNIQQL